MPYAADARRGRPIEADRPDSGYYDESLVLAQVQPVISSITLGGEG
jgi:hypothetical protein